MDIQAARRKLAQRRETMNRLRGRPLTASERLANLRAALLRCDECDGQLKTIASRVCPHCGYQLV